MSEAQIRIGIGGWTYPPWRGVFYPDKLAAGERARICVAPARRDRDQRHFLRPPEAEELGDMGEDRARRLPVRDQGLALLRDALEAGRGRARGSAISSPRASRRSGRSSGRSCGSSPRAGKFDRDDIAGFIDLLPEKLDGIPLRHAIEPRHESFRDEQFFDLCRDAQHRRRVRRFATNIRCIEADTANFAYARLQRMSEDMPTGYDDAALDGFANARAAMGKGRPRRLHLHDQRRQGARARRRAGAAGTASLSIRACALPTSRSASACSRPTAAWARRSPPRSPTIRASRSTRIMATCWSISPRPPRCRRASTARCRRASRSCRHHRPRRARRPARSPPPRTKSRCCARRTRRSASRCLPTWSSGRPRVLGPDWDIEIAEMHHRHQGRRAVGHRADARRSGGARARRRR